MSRSKSQSLTVWISKYPCPPHIYPLSLSVPCPCALLFAFQPLSEHSRCRAVTNNPSQNKTWRKCKNVVEERGGNKRERGRTKQPGLEEEQGRVTLPSAEFILVIFLPWIVLSQFPPPLYYFSASSAFAAVWRDRLVLPCRGGMQMARCSTPPLLPHPSLPYSFFFPPLFSSIPNESGELIRRTQN